MNTRAFLTMEAPDRVRPLEDEEEVVPDYMATYQRICEEADIVIPLNDPEGVERFPEGQVA